MVAIASLFVGEGWELTMGVMFMVLVIFLPGGVMEGVRRIWAYVQKRMNGKPAAAEAAAQTSTGA